MEIPTEHGAWGIVSALGNSAPAGPQLDFLLEHILDFLEEWLSASKAAICLKDASSDRLVVRACRGLPGDSRIDYSETSAQIFTSARTISMIDVTEQSMGHTGPKRQRASSEKLSFVGVPLVSRGTTMGVLWACFPYDGSSSLEPKARFVEKMGSLMSRLLAMNEKASRCPGHDGAGHSAAVVEVRERVESFLSLEDYPETSHVICNLRHAAQTREPVLIRGEQGVGKSLAARAIHELSEMSTGPFVRINCAGYGGAPLTTGLSAIEEGENAGFGSGKALLEMARGGTLLLAGIESLSRKEQDLFVRHLRRINWSDPKFTRLALHGVRLLVASRTDLGSAVESGSFSAELFRLLTPVIVSIPPLRERQEHLSHLIGFFVDRIYRESGVKLRFAPRSLRLLQRYSWPGNVRELENLMERMAFMGGPREIGVDHLAPYTSSSCLNVGSADNGSHDLLQSMEKRTVISALERNNWIQSRSAGELGITNRQMGYRIKKYGLEDLVKKNRLLYKSGE